MSLLPSTTGSSPKSYAEEKREGYRRLDLKDMQRRRREKGEKG